MHASFCAERQLPTGQRACTRSVCICRFCLFDYEKYITLTYELTYTSPEQHSDLPLPAGQAWQQLADGSGHSTVLRGVATRVPAGDWYTIGHYIQCNDDVMLHVAVACNVCCLRSSCNVLLLLLLPLLHPLLQLACWPYKQH
jgi:hypothetical protein